MKEDKILSKLEEILAILRDIQRALQKSPEEREKPVKAQTQQKENLFLNMPEFHAFKEMQTQINPSASGTQKPVRDFSSSYHVLKCHRCGKSVTIHKDLYIYDMTVKCNDCIGK